MWPLLCIARNIFELWNRSKRIKHCVSDILLKAGNYPGFPYFPIYTLSGEITRVANPNPNASGILFARNLAQERMFILNLMSLSPAKKT